jgi:hypothetical protein
MVGAVCFGGTLMGGMLAAALVLNGALGSSGELAASERIPAALQTGYLGVLYGGVLGLIEGLFLAFPLAAILGLLRNGDQS